MLKTRFTISLLLACSAIGYAQKLLFHKNRHREALYKTGDVISFRMKNDKTKFTEKILRFQDSVIVFEDFVVNPNKISHMYVDAKTKVWYILRFKYAKVLIYLGVGYTGLDWLNTGVLTERTAVIGGSLIAAGVLAKVIISDKIKIKGRRKLAILH